MVMVSSWKLYVRMACEVWGGAGIDAGILRGGILVGGVVVVAVGMMVVAVGMLMRAGILVGGVVVVAVGIVSFSKEWCL